MQSSITQIKRILSIYKESEGHIRPHFILTGPSGSGKTFTIEALAQDMEINVIEVNAASLTKEGTSGNSLSKALTPLLQYPADIPTIVFVDEFDKLFISGNSNSQLAHETTNGVQNEFLKVIESKANVFSDYGKYVETPTDHILFIFAGAFNGEDNISIDRLREMGVKTEFLGRVGLTYNIQKPTLEDLRNILENSRLLAHYDELFEDISRDAAIEEIFKVIEDTYEFNTLGVRVINTLIHKFYIEGGLLPKEVQKVTFRKKLKFNEAA